MSALENQPTETLGDPVFPIEIFGLIIEDLASGLIRKPDAVGDIRACSLVCKGFVSLCRPHLFRRISIGRYEREQGALDRLTHLLGQNPEIQDFINEVHYNTTRYISAPHEPLYDLLSRLQSLTLLILDFKDDRYPSSFDMRTCLHHSRRSLTMLSIQMRGPRYDSIRDITTPARLATALANVSGHNRIQRVEIEMTVTAMREGFNPQRRWTDVTRKSWTQVGELLSDDGENRAFPFLQMVCIVLSGTGSMTMGEIWKYPLPLSSSLSFSNKDFLR
ncbi:hypothetical protein BJ165DRAFT_1528649 [Panaeolus papilionaceus]|nr:hypothetical protein BJ165DRAFT_1528649 [Panaeolus papilionaceus]